MGKTKPFSFPLNATAGHVFLVLTFSSIPEAGDLPCLPSEPEHFVYKCLLTQHVLESVGC